MKGKVRVLLPSFIVIAVVAAIAMSGAGSSVAAFGNQPSFVQFTLEGCDQDGNIMFPNSNPGPGNPAGFTCPDNRYGTGNQGKNWNELDLVPMRLTTDLGNQAGATTDYSIVLAADYQDNSGGDFGFDVVTAPVVNTDESDTNGECAAVVDPSFTGPALTGGAASSIAQIVTIHQKKGSTCVFDWTQRLAVGAHNFSGSSLQSYLFQTSDFTGSKKTVPLPVDESLPQALSKDMTGQQNTNTPWNLVKSATPTTLSFGNVCDPGYTGSANVGVTITWTKLAPVPSGSILLTTNIYASNPSARSITTNVTDQMYAGAPGDSSTPVGSLFTASVVVPANTSNFLVGTHTATVPASSATQYHDDAHATYVDTLTGVPIPQTTDAHASTGINTGTNTNSDATITDTESITGSGLAFSVAAPSVGSFTNGYTAGSSTVGPVNWSSGVQSGSGGITFAKTITLDPKQVTSGALSDTATLNGSDGFGPITAGVSVNIASSAETSLTINKTIPDVLTGSETAVFTFHVAGQTKTITFTAGETSKSVVVNGIAPGTYQVTEDAVTGWNTDSAKSADLTLPSHCTNSVTFNNTVPPATATAHKVTDPAGGESGWTFTMTKPDGTTQALVTNAAGDIDFGSLTQQGQYTIVETAKPGYTQVSAVGCTFTVNFPADSGHAYSCTITNRQDATLTIVKVTNPANSGTDSFPFTSASGGVDPSFSLDTNGATALPSQRVFTFSGALSNYGTKAVTEGSTIAWNLTGVVCSKTNSTPNTATATVVVNPGDNVTCTFTNAHTATITLVKVTDPADSGPSVFSFAGGGNGVLANFLLDTHNLGANARTFTFTGLSGALFGVKTASETALPGWTLISANCLGGTDTDGSLAGISVNVQAGDNVICTFTNRMRYGVQLDKTVNGAALQAGQSFSFQLRAGADATHTGTIIDTLTTNAAGHITFPDSLVPGQDYQLCEVLQTGFGPVWPSGFGPFNPNNDANVLCINFDLSIADVLALANLVKTFSIDNTHNTVAGLTIGYWKTHGPANCKQGKGNQSDILSQFIGNGIELGANYTETNACYLVQLLSKNNINGVKQPGDPIFNMVAQLVAVELNIEDGTSATCDTMPTYLSQAQTLLTNINFNGVSYTKPLTQAQIDLATTLNTKFDLYNNNNLPGC